MRLKFDLSLKLASLVFLVVLGFTFFYNYFVFPGFVSGIVAGYLVLPKFFAWSEDRKREKLERLRREVVKLEDELNVD